MERVTLPNAPAKRSADFQLDGFDPPRFARVVYQPQETKPDRVMVEAQAFEVDADGRLVAYSTGAPSRTSGTLHMIGKSGVGDTHTLQPGWVRVVGDYSPTPDPDSKQTALPEGCQIVSEKPATGNPGDLIYVDPTMYRWDEGMLEGVMKAKAEELAGLIRNTAAIADIEL